ncbi:hypothetical protein MMC31_007623 [Peltigera leucophlebia]|nr:hypothetical protein [Peltigera leucophlebia]
MENPLGPIPESDDPPYSNEETSSSALHREQADVRELNIDNNESPSVKSRPNRALTPPISEKKERFRRERVLPSGSRDNENEPKENPPKRAATGDTFESLSFEETSVWDQKSILSLDGGGIRGYSSLLILRALMNAIGEIERKWSSDPAESSFHPLEQPPSVDSDAPPRDPILNTASSPWLPCHYFDYMAGTSTGGLIGIMLGRLRMSIDDCITEYETLGPKVFAHPRPFHLRTLRFWPCDKYDHRSLEKAIREVIDRRSPSVGGGDKNFASDENRCRTIVLSYRKQESRGVETPYVFRSYDNLHRNEDPDKRLLDRNPGVADKNEIWKVARATTAAPTYFKPMKIDHDEHLDGGFGANNPCAEICDEVRRMNNNAEHCVGTIVSVGTGKCLQGRFQGTGLKRYIGFFYFATKWASESEMVHTNMARLNIRSYARFNVETELGSMKLDEWRYRGSLRIKTGEAISKLRSRQREVISKLRSRQREAISKLRSRRRDHDPQTTTKNENPTDNDEKNPKILPPQKQNLRKDRKTYE